jgi:outer membrane protein assembly factor BamA
MRALERFIRSILRHLALAYCVYHKDMKWLLLFLALASGLGFGQTRPASKNPQEKAETPAPTKWPVVSLAVEGNRRYTQEQILAVAGIKPGQVAGKEEFDAARDRLVASGFFEMVGYKFDPTPGKDGIAGLFQVTEVDAGYPARFEGLGVAGSELESMLHGRDPLFSTKQLPPTKPVLDRYAAWIQEYLASKGSQEKVAARLNPVGPDQFEIVFRPARNLPAVAQVTFDGNKVLPQGVLRESISSVAVGSPYTEEHFRELLNTAVRPVYEARGRVRIAFPKVRAEPLNDVQGLHVFVTVDEGESYQLGKVEIAGPSPVRPEELIKAGKFQTAEVANFDRVNDGLENIRKSLLHAGFMEAKVSMTRMIDDAKKTVDVAVHLDPGPRFLMGKLTVVGLDLDGEAEMRRIWGIQEGKPFNADYPQIFLNSIREQGLFDNLGQTKPAVKVNDQDHTVDVTLNFAAEGPKPKQKRPGPFGQ